MAEQTTRKISFRAGGEEFLYDSASGRLTQVDLPAMKEASKPLTTDQDVLERLAKTDREDAEKFAVLLAISDRLDQFPDEDFSVRKDIVRAAINQRLSGFRRLASMSNQDFQIEHTKNQAALRDLIRKEVGRDEFEAKFILDAISKEIEKLAAQVRSESN